MGVDEPRATLPPLRALVGARVSVVQGPQKVSHEAQIESTTRWAASKGYEVVGTFQDLGVSAEKRPEDRPELGRWLTDEGATEWDVIVWSKMDRAFRSTRHCVDFARWAEERHKMVVFADDGLTLDYRPGAAKGIDAMMAELFVYLGSFFAQLELNRFKSRATDSHRELRQRDRWASGVPPLGFKVVDHPSGKGKGLETDPEGKELLHEMARKLLDGWSYVRIAAWLTETGALTNRDRALVAKGKEPRRKPWNVTVVANALTSPKTQGIKTYKDVPVLDGDGEPVRLAPPTFDPDTWKQIQDAAASRKQNRRAPTGSVNPMLGVGFCRLCGASLVQQTIRDRNGSDKSWRIYRCSRTPKNCRGVSMRASDADLLMEETFLERWGDEKVTRRVFVAGEDHSHELEQVLASIERLRKESDAGLIVSDDDERVYLQRMKALVDRRTELESKPHRAAGWVTEETGQTYREVWHSDQEDLVKFRRQLMVDHGVRFELESGKPPRWHIFRPEDGVPFADTQVVGQ
ncbi:recombinase family protein [Mycobacterium sp. EPG1]|nr:recombinase family protein [Mycobacterium sp. EPG1]